MKILIKTKNGLLNLGEGMIYSKKDLRLNEDNGINANISSASSIRHAQVMAQKYANQNSGVTGATIQAGNADNQHDSNGEGIKIELPMNASGQELAQADAMTRNQNMDDAQITFVKPQSSTNNTNESKITELKMNSIPFTKAELHNFLTNL